MGLACHANGRGAKASLQSSFPTAFTRAEGLAAARETMHVQREQVAVIADGNVMLRQIPSSATKMRDFVFFFFRMTWGLVSAGERVVIAFDEAEHTTRAKVEEQSRRDSTRTARHVAPQVAELTDEFDAAFLEDFANVALIMDNRVARSRFIDEVAKQVNARVQAETAKFFLRGTVLKLAWDGIDMRGADRPYGSARVAQFHGDASLLVVIQRERPLGEGDLKMQDIAYRVHRSAQEGGECADVRLVLHSTIDTDAFPICLLNEDRLNREFPLNRTTRDVVAFKEMAPRKRKDAEEDGGGGGAAAEDKRFLLCDVSTLYNCIVRAAFPRRDPILAVSPADRRRLFALFALSAAVSGCDFLVVKGANFEDTLQGAFRMIRNNTSTVALLDDMVDGDEGTLLNMTPLVKELLEHTSAVLSERPRMGKASQSVREAHPEALRRAVFCASYWSGNEQKNTSAFGFVPLKG